MTLENLGTDLETAYSELDDELAVDLDEETKHELAMLVAAMDPDDVDDLFRRGLHMLFRSAVETGKLDFHLRSTYDVTYDEYLSGMTYDEMAGGGYQPEPGSGSGSDERRYQF